MTNRYDTAGIIEAQYEPGSDKRVLANKLGITDPAEIDATELDLLNQLYTAVINSVREGNGRLSRLLVNVMALQAGWPELDFTIWDTRKADYFAAIQAGLNDYGPMKRLVTQVLRASAPKADD